MEVRRIVVVGRHEDHQPAECAQSRHAHPLPSATYQTLPITSSDAVEPTDARYASRMADVSAAQLQGDTLGVLTRVVNGEDMRVTVDGRPVAVLRAVERRGTWMKRDDFVRRFVGRQADSALTGELEAFSEDTGGEVDFL